MALYGLDAVSSYLLVVALATLLAAILVWQPFRNKRTVNVWLASSVVGVLLGTAIPCALMELNGYALTQSPSPSSRSGGDPGTGCQMMGGSGGHGAGCPMTAASGGHGNDCPMMGGAGGPRPKQDLTTLVRKLDLLTGDIGITLTAEQATAVNDCLKDIEKSPKLSDNDAKAKHDKLMAVLNEKQKARLEAIGLPQPARSGGHGMGANTHCMMGGGMPGMTGHGGAPKQDENQNPFQQDAEGKAVKSLRERLASKGTASKADAPKSPAPKS